MRFVSVRELHGRAARVWEQLGRDRELVITSNGKPVAILSAVTEGNLEEALAAFRRARAMAAVAALQMKSVETGRDRTSLREINAAIAAERKGRKR